MKSVFAINNDLFIENNSFYATFGNLAKITKPASDEAKPVKNNTINVLLVDDLESVRESLRIILTLEDDIEVVGEATSGPEAVEVARQLQPDVVITDLEMPDGGDFDGIEACAQIKQENLARAVIILTIHSDFANRKRAEEANCDLFLEKGLSSSELVKQLRCCIKDK
ncbi:MAG: response regulator transcription factor [Chloroflexi bacterium]|uniref:Response regulator transcription factor n=1 Tax=Candidatus Chlorohelix allophototropha TaxID=3003348 RepID=A0A8T7M2G5_9CHLR|nr:response regulator transcription factor [Chloroflexota bacterium]WJW67142.1 response regulator transcription factor [Chloroflexota bacterium L227-S17]